MCGICVFFFKQKTAYEMRISDWSSDVCSSDLALDALCRQFGELNTTGGALSANLERKEMIVVPAHGGLNDVVEILEAGDGRNLDAAPDRRVGFGQPDFHTGEEGGQWRVTGTTSSLQVAGGSGMGSRTCARDAQAYGSG